MRFDVITLFPEMFTPFLSSGVTHRAFVPDIIDLHFLNPRDHALGNYRRVDDRPFGGGPGMVMLAEPLARSVEAIRTMRADRAPVIFFSPTGQRINQAVIERWSCSTGAILLCGRYEGVDERFIEQYVDVELSLGDFVLSGGEIAALAFLDALARIQPSVLNDAQSYEMDSFGRSIDGLLDCSQYTRPKHWQGTDVPAVLLSGHHLNIERWRRQQRLKKTLLCRPDLLQCARQSGLLTADDESYLCTIRRT
jgi:tRNA (guanine37-N1)-methyltransferase